jgi:hypothetical protein
MATICFEKANDAYREKWARAAWLVATAESVMPTNLVLGQASLQKASDIYESIGMHEKAATCYIKLGDYKRAGVDSITFQLYRYFCNSITLKNGKLLLGASVIEPQKLTPKNLLSKPNSQENSGYWLGGWFLIDPQKMNPQKGRFELHFSYIVHPYEHSTWSTA